MKPLLSLFALIFACRLGAEEEPVLFADLSFEAASAKAKEEGKWLFVEFMADWAHPSEKLKQTTWKDQDIITLMREAAVSIRIDVDQHKKLAREVDIGGLPTLLFRDRNGKEFGREIGYQSPEDFKALVAAFKSGKTSLDLAREAYEIDSDKNGYSRFEYASALRSAGRYEEALEHLLSLWKNVEVTGMGVTRRYNHFQRELERILANYEGKENVLDDLRASTEKRWVETENVKVLGALSNLNKEFGYDDANLALYDRLDSKSPGRRVLAGKIFEQIIKAERYKDAGIIFNFDRRLEQAIKGVREKIEGAGKESPERRVEVENAQFDWLANEVATGIRSMLEANKISQAVAYAKTVLSAFEDKRFRTTIVEAAAEAGFAKFIDAVEKKPQAEG